MKMRMGMPLNGGGGVDPYWSFVNTLLINDNKADATTTFTNQGSGPSYTAVGNAQYDDAQAPTGLSTSALFDGTGDRIVSDSNITIGANDFALEFWLRPTTVAAGTKMLVDMRNALGGAQPAILRNGSQIRLFCDNAAKIDAGTIAINTWYHVALSETSGTEELYLAGTRIGTYATSTSFAAGVMTIADRVSTGTGFAGHIAAVRLTVGSNRGYTGASITVPSLPLPTS